MLGELTQAAAFAQAVQAAAEADVLVISIRDGGELPLFLYVWIHAWLPRRAGRPGTLVALIGVRALPEVQIGHTRPYLEAVARCGGLDFFPQESRLPEAPVASACRPGLLPQSNLVGRGLAGHSALLRAIAAGRLTRG